MHSMMRWGCTSTMKSIEPFRVMAILARARELEARGRSIIHMEIGEPDFPTPAPIVEAATRAISGGNVHYAQTCGIPELREAIARHYEEQYRVQVSPSRVIVTPGASGALTLILAALIEPGDRVLVTTPGYPCHRNIVAVMRGEAIEIPLEAAERYQLNAEALARFWDPRTRALILASPSNPTGAVATGEALAAIARFVRSRGGVLIADEVYHGLTYGCSAPTALAGDVVVINSFSKYFNMTGWRLGWLISPQHWTGALDRLAQNLFLASSTVAQRAALAAFLPETRAILEARRREFERRRDVLLPALAEIGFDVPFAPDGAFYVYAGCGTFTTNSTRFCESLLEQAGVAITPGEDFGRYRGQEHVRFAYTTPCAELLEGVRRIRQFVARAST